MYKFDAAKLLRFPAGRRSGGASEVYDEAIVRVPRPHVARITDLLDHPQSTGVAFQSVLVSSVQVIENVLAYQREIARNAISLAQREKISEMVQILEETVGALLKGLNDQGKRMLAMRPPVEPVRRGDDAWWYLLAEAAESAEKGAAIIAQIVAGQPRGGPSRILSSILARVLHRQHRALIREADTWRR